MQLLTKVSEKDIGSHDMAIPLSRLREQIVHIQILLLSAFDFTATGNGTSRIERLYHLNGGQNCAIVFLLNSKDWTDGSVIPYMDLQVK